MLDLIQDLPFSLSNSKQLLVIQLANYELLIKVRIFYHFRDNCLIRIMIKELSFDRH